MPEETPQPTPQEKSAEGSVEIKPDDILKRVSQHKEEKPQKTETLANSDDIEKIKDPEARELVMNLQKSWEKGYNKKFMELAEQRRQLEQQIAKEKQWTPERLQEALKDPTFLNLVQREAQSQQHVAPPSNYDGSDEEWSSLSVAEQNRIRKLESQMQQFMTDQEKREIQLADERIKERFDNYSPERINDIQQQLLKGNISNSEIREWIYKADSYEDAVRNAYQMGLEDRKAHATEKMNGITNIDTNRTQIADFTERKQGKSSKEHFKEVAANVLQKMGAR